MTPPPKSPRRSCLYSWASAPRAAGILLCLSACIPAFSASQRAPEPPPEYHVKAAFLLNFTRFVEWPPEAFPNDESPFGVCVAGNDPFGGVLDAIFEGETANSRPVAIHRIKGEVPKACHLLFIGASENHPGGLLAGLPPGVLTIGEEEPFIRAGGVIAFVVEKRRVRFDINQTAARKAALKISSRLLSIARTVE
ncbi:MAG: YfiR family protein [Bryobacteraceae bacterium]|nr:YfiR family protein [Bryobacteraceae bacterium]